MTLSLLLVFVGFFILYQNSKRTTIDVEMKFIRWFQYQRINAKGVGNSLLTLAAAFSGLNNGLIAGSLIFVIQLMTIGSLIIILSPLRMLNYKFVFSLMTISFIIELLTN